MNLEDKIRSSPERRERFEARTKRIVREKFGQSRKMSFAESCMNTAVGFSINTSANYFLLPFFGLFPTVSESMSIAVMFTLISVARNYMLRRMFNAVR